MELKRNDLYLVVGGISSAFLNSLSRAVMSILKLGQTIGSNIRRFFGKSYC
ncbi:MAG: hypothetical protein RSF02_00215 [Bacilli bacterium]